LFSSKGIPELIFRDHTIRIYVEGFSLNGVSETLFSSIILVRKKITMSHTQSYPKVTIIILHMKEKLCIVDCVGSLNKITYQNFDIIVVHNGPEDTALRDALSTISQHITKVIDTEENLGFARGNNFGIRQALKDGAEYILLLNDDTEVAPDFLTKLMKTAEVQQDAGMLGPKVFLYDQPKKIWFAGARFDQRACEIVTSEFDRTGKHEDSNFVESDYVTGCALLVKRKVVEKIGLLDERFFLYWEDVDWGLRCIKAGFKNLIVTRSLIWHKASASSGGVNSLPRVYHKARSHLYMAGIYAPQTLCKLQRGYFRDIVWLLLKSPDENRTKRILACLLAIIDYHLRKIGKGPFWLWAKK
jgi:GT2 family glycosyltransferase